VCCNLEQQASGEGGFFVPICSRTRASSFMQQCPLVTAALPHESFECLPHFLLLFTLGCVMQPLLTEACTVAPQLAPGMTPQGLGNVVWAMSMLIGYVPPTVLDATQDACLNKDLARFGSVNLVLVVGALARQGSMRVELGVAINRAVERTLPSFSGENLCKYVHHGRLAVRLYSPSLLGSLTYAQPDCLLQMNTVDMSVTCRPKVCMKRLLYICLSCGTCCRYDAVGSLL
jgi:hypothetical protein